MCGQLKPTSKLSSQIRSVAPCLPITYPMQFFGIYVVPRDNIGESDVRACVSKRTHTHTYKHEHKHKQWYQSTSTIVALTDLLQVYTELLPSGTNTQARSSNEHDTVQSSDESTPTRTHHTYIPKPCRSYPSSQMPFVQQRRLVLGVEQA